MKDAMETYSASSGPPPSLSAGILIRSLDKKSCEAMVIEDSSIMIDIKIRINNLGFARDRPGEPDILHQDQLEEDVVIPGG